MKASSVVAGFVFLAVGLAAMAQEGRLGGVSAGKPSLLKAGLSRLPIYFVKNGGVYPDEVVYYVQGADKTLFFTREGITFRLKSSERPWVVKLSFVGARADVVPRGEDRQQAVFSYFKGPRKNWRTGLESFSRIVYENLWPGIDLVYRSAGQKLKYDFVVKPGADPAAVRLRYTGTTSFGVTASGGLRVQTPAGGFEDEPPVAWQESGDARSSVDVRFEAHGREDRGNEPGHTFGFRVGAYDRTRALILDPAVLVSCGYLGGTGGEWGVGDIACDASGNMYVAGGTDSNETTFPVQVGPDLTFNGAWGASRIYPGDAFVAKVNASGTALLYCGFIGGGAGDWASGIAVDPTGQVYVTGSAVSDQTTFPVTVGPGLTHQGPGSVPNAYVCKVNAQGTALVYCGYITGANGSSGEGIAVDTSGHAYVTGTTSSDQTTFPVSLGPDLTHNGGDDAFVAKVSPSGQSLLYCGYIGGSGSERGIDIALDAAGHAYVAGSTPSTEGTFPVIVGPDLTYNGGSYDAFVAKVSPSGQSLLYCGYIGGSGYDRAMGVAVDGSGCMSVAGVTDSSEATFPVTVGPDLTYNGNGDAFVARVNPSGGTLLHCGYIGGASYDLAHGMAVDVAGNAYVVGATTSTEATFPVTSGPDSTFNGDRDGFVALVGATGTTVVYCGYLGGMVYDEVGDVAIDPCGNACVYGWTSSSESSFPVRVGPDLTFNGMVGFFDAFVARVGHTHLSVSGIPRPAQTVSLTLVATSDGGLPYQLGTSLRPGKISFKSGRLYLLVDDLLRVSVAGLLPGTFSGYRGVIDAKGQATAAIHLPPVYALVGTSLHTGFVTLDPRAPEGIRSVSNTEIFSILP